MSDDLDGLLQRLEDYDSAYRVTHPGQTSITGDAAIAIRGLMGLLDALPMTSSINGQVVGRCDSNHRVISRAEYKRLNDCRRIISDLDRSEVGRHAGDVESQSPTGVSEGNPHALPTDQRIGTTLDGAPITWGDLVAVVRTEADR